MKERRNILFRWLSSRCKLKEKLQMKAKILRSVCLYNLTGVTIIRHEVHVQCLMSANDSGSIVLELRDNNFNCFENTSVSKFSGNDALA